jgi:hypothetical protein
MFGRYQSQTTRQLAQIQSSKYPDTDKDLEANLHRINQFVDYIAQYLQVMQKGVDQANEDAIQRTRDMASDLVVLLGGGELLYGINLGDLQYFLPALGAIFGFDSDKPFPISLFEMAEHFLLGYVIPLDSFVLEIQNIIDGWLVAMGIDQEFIDALDELLTAINAVTSDTLGLFEDLWGLLDILGINTDGFGPFADLWHTITQLLGSLGLKQLGDLVDPVFHALAPWISELAQFVDMLDSIIKAFSGGLTDIQGLLNLAGLITPFTDLMAAAFDPLTAWTDIFTNALLPDLTGAGGIPYFNNLSALIPGLDNLGGIFDPQTIWNSVITDFLNPSGLIEAIASMDWGQLAEGIFGISGITDATGFSNLGTNFMSLLGNPNLGLPTGTFDPIAEAEQMLQSVLTPAGALTTWTQVPPHLFGFLSSGQTASANVLPDPGFDDPSVVNGQALWTHDTTVGRTVTSSVVGSIKTIAGSVLRSMKGVPIAVKAGDAITLATHVRWTGLTAAPGNAIVLAANAYDANDNLIADPTNRIVAAIATPGTNSSSYAGVDAFGFVNIQGGYVAPTDTAYVRLVMEVTSVVTAGSVWFDDCMMQIPSVVDATLLGNWASMAEGVIPGPVLAGFQGLVNIFESFAHLVDGMGTAASLTPQIGLDFSQLFSFMQNLATHADQGGTQGAINTNILNIRTNKWLGAGMHPTSESMLPLSSFGTGGAMTTTAVAAGNAIGQPFRPAEVAKKGFFEFIASGTSLTNIFVNIYSVNPTTGAHSLLYGSTDQSSLIGTTLGHVKVLIPGASQPTVNAGSSLFAEIVNNGANPLTVVTKNTGQPTHPEDYPFNIGATRALASTGGVSPASLTNAQITRTANTPYINLGITDVAANYVPPVVSKYSGAGTWSKPGGFVAGDLVDIFVLGGAGGGQSGGYGLSGSGGDAGHWVVQTYVLDSDPRGTGYPILPLTQILNIVTGVGGGGGVNPYTFQPGNAGTDSTVSGTSFATLTGAGGQGGGRSGQSNAGNTGGQAAGNRTVGDYTAYGGAATGVNSSASQPGGGGPSGYPAFGAQGGRGEVTIRTRQWDTV